MKEGSVRPGWDTGDWAGLPAVTIHPYDPGWMEQYERAREEIGLALAGLDVRIEHVGSTAVPGLGARAGIDILIGLRGFMQSLAQEAPTVKVCTILPGSVMTDFGPRSRAEKAASGNKYLTPEDVAEAVLFVLRQSERAWTQEMQLWPFA